MEEKKVKTPTQEEFQEKLQAEYERNRADFEETIKTRWFKHILKFFEDLKRDNLYIMRSKQEHLIMLQAQSYYNVGHGFIEIMSKKSKEVQKELIKSKE